MYIATPQTVVKFVNLTYLKAAVLDVEEFA
jgi:hypothetical protein